MRALGHQDSVGFGHFLQSSWGRWWRPPPRTGDPDTGTRGRGQAWGPAQVAAGRRLPGGGSTFTHRSGSAGDVPGTAPRPCLRAVFRSPVSLPSAPALDLPPPPTCARGGPGAETPAGTGLVMKTSSKVFLFLLISLKTEQEMV